MRIPKKAKRLGEYCNGVRMGGPYKGVKCCGATVVLGENGKAYCRNHVHQGDTKERGNE